MNVKTGLKKLQRFSEDRQNLVNLISLIPQYFDSIMAADTQQELDSIKGEIEPLYRKMQSWRFHRSDYSYFGKNLKQIRQVLNLIEARNGALGSGKKSQAAADIETKIELVTKPQKQSQPRELQTVSLQPYSPTLVDLLNFYRHNGLVGEEKTAILQTLGAIHGLCFGIESLSGSGKTYSLDILLDLLPQEHVYVLKQSSDKALLYDMDRANRAKVIVATELQKSAGSKTIIEVLKDLGEGKSAERKVTNLDRTGIIEQKIEAGKSVIYTLALEDWFKKDRELERRYFQLYTDISEEQTRRILGAAAQREFMQDNDLRVLSDKDVRALKAHIKNCMDLPNFRHINPFASVIIENMPPKIKARSFVNHYFNLIQASARFHHDNRLNEGGNIFIDLEDVYYIQQLYHEQFFKSVLRIPIAGEDLLAVFDNSYICPSDIHKKLKRQKSPLTFPVIGDMLEELTEAGYLEKDSYITREPRYRKIADLSGFEQSLDWQKCFDIGCSVVRKNYPRLFEKWLAKQLEGNKIAVLDPLQNKEGIIAEYS